VAATLLDGEPAAVQEDALAAVLTQRRHTFPEVQVTEECCLGRPAADLLEAGGGARLVVVGRRNRTFAIGTHTGPVTHSVLHCSAPVAVVAHD
jgi:hypothetical protein